MIKFNWQVLNKACRGDCRLIVEFFRKIAKKEPIVKLQHQTALRAKNKFSYLRDPLSLVNNEANATNSEICMYIYLASLRNFGDYYVSNTTALHVDYCDIKVELLGSNRLLTIEDNYIHFKYEE